GQSLYYVSESWSPTPAATKDARPCMVANVLRVDLAKKGPPEPITKHTEDGVRLARISANGEWIVYECGPDVWVTDTHGGTPRKLAIEVHADDKVNTER